MIISGMTKDGKTPGVGSTEYNRRYVANAEPDDIDAMNDPLSLVLAAIARNTLLCHLRGVDVAPEVEARLRQTLVDLRKAVFP